MPDGEYRVARGANAPDPPVKDNVTTDMDLSDMVQYLPLAADLAVSRQIERYYIGPPQVTSWINYSGSSVLLPIRSAVLEVMRQALNTP